MPELPEVETVRRQLAARLAGRRILDAEFRWPRLFRSPGLPEARRVLRGRRVGMVERRGKHLLMHLDGGRTMLAHLGMSGGFRFAAEVDPNEVHALAVFRLDDGTKLVYRDPRRFGRMRLVDSATLLTVPELARLGPEPLSLAFTPAVLARNLRPTRAPVKVSLLDQRRVAGIGNIYASEALYRAGIHPRTPGRRLEGYDFISLCREIREVLTDAIERQGTTIRSYADARGERGGYAGELRVYGREGLPCGHCGSPIRRTVEGGRSTFFCPECQPER